MIYIAGASAELERCSRAIDYARSIGAKVAHDWPAVLEAWLRVQRMVEEGMYR